MDQDKPLRDDKMVVISHSHGGVGKILVRDDTILANLQGCAGCGRAQFNCGGMKKTWSSLCWGKQTEKKYYCYLTVLTATFVLSLIGTIFFCFTDALNDAILSNMVLRNGSLSFAMWRRPSVQPLMKVHIFNYTNWEEVRRGDETVLRVQDVGPYSYTQQMERVNVKFQGDQLSYQERSIFRYRPDKSIGAQFDQVIVPNLPLLGVVSKAVDLNLNAFGQLALDSILRLANHPEAFVQLPVQRFLWGYDDTIIEHAKPILSLQGQLRFDKFGLLTTKNGTAPENFTINTGERDMHRMNILERLDGERQLHFWGNEDCNSIEASDGSMFPQSMLDRNQTLQVFFPNLCRRLPFVYEKDVELFDGIQLLRYRMPENVFDDPIHNIANQCYCEIDTATCPPRGVINVTACTMGAPALASFPHFHHGDPRLREEVLGLNPDPEQHQSYLDIHPTLGIALGGRSSLQINIQVRKTPMYSALYSLPQDLILPVAWIDMGLEELPQNIRSLVYHGTFSTAAAQLGLTIACIVPLCVSGICLLIMIIRRMNKSPRPCITVKLPVSIDTELKQALNNQTS